MKKTHNFELQECEVLVLHELLIRIDEQGVLKDFFVDQAEQVILWNLEGLCEKNSTSIFSKNYLECVKKARDQLRHDES